MNTPKKTWLIGVLLTLFVAACSSDPSVGDLSALAQSNASQPSSETAGEISESLTEAESDVAMAIFTDLESRFPLSSPTDDIAAGGPCPFGEQYGAFFVERARLICFDEATGAVSLVSPNPLSVQTQLANFEVMLDDTGTVEWLEGDLGGERFVFVERLVSGLSVASAQAVRDGNDSESVAMALSDQLTESAIDRVEALAMFDLDQILATVTEIFDTER